MKKIFLLLIILLSSIISYGQCTDPNEIEVAIVVHSDDYGYEGYWQLIPSGNDCDTETIGEGGNPNVGCDGAGAQDQTPGGYSNNNTFDEGPWCLTIGEAYDLVYVDDWGDGGFSFDVIINGYQVVSFEGIGLGATFTFIADEPFSYDIAVTNTNLYSYVTIGSYDLEAHVFNNGTTTINSYDLTYSINNGEEFTHNVSSTSLENFESESVEHSIPINIDTEGVYTIKVWVDNLDGNEDLNHSNDTLITQVEAGPGIPNNLDLYISSPISVVEIAGSSNQINDPTDLDFHPVLSNMELWVVNRGTENSGGSTVTIFGAGTDDQSSVYRQDGNAWHFMSLPTGIAFSENGHWANSPGVFDANHNGGAAFTGPALWSSDMSIYAQPSGGNGSHLDMLHASPYSQGIAAERDNVFWVFDGFSDDLVRYDFASDHGAGNAFHGDAVIQRYSEDQLAKDPADNIVSHLVLDENKTWLYVVDHGHNKVIRIDITSGMEGGTPNYTANEPVEEYSNYINYTSETIVSDIVKPAGIDVIEDRMIVSEHLSGVIKIFDISVIPAIELASISTGMNSVQGVKIGPDGKIWFVDKNTNGVYRIDIGTVGISELQNDDFQIYPNPTNGIVYYSSSKNVGRDITVYDIQGKMVFSHFVNSKNETLDLTLNSGIYILNILENDQIIAIQKLMIE